MPNRIINTALINNITSGGRSISLKYATKPDNWTRPILAQSVKDDFSKAIEKANVPAKAATGILAYESEHPSESDSKDHFTTVYEDHDGNHISTKHVYP